MARSKKTRTMRGKLGKTGSKEMMKEQKKAQKSKEPRRFHTKKAQLRKEQAQKKLARLGLLPEVAESAAPVRPRRFTFVAPKTETVEAVIVAVEEQSEDLSVNDLMDAFTESNR
jgi:hypothetical protein